MSDDWKDDAEQPKKPAPPLETGNNAAVILEARHLAEAGKGKIRAEATIWHMTDAHFVQVVEWMLAGLPYRRIAELCQRELKLPPAKVPGNAAQSAFWQEFSPSWFIARRRSHSRVLNAVNAEIAAAPLEVDAALRDEIKQRAWELLQHPNPPEKLVKAFLNAVLKLRDQDDRKEDRKLVRENFDAAQRTKIEAGLEAMRVEIAGNEPALAAWRALKETLAA
jgi:hypothetical protein